MDTVQRSSSFRYSSLLVGTFFSRWFAVFQAKSDRKRALIMGQCGQLKLIPAQGRWWVGRALRSQHNLGRSSLAFWSCWSRREPRSKPSADPRHFHAYGGFAHPQREPGIAMTIETYSGTHGHVGRATICLDSHGYCPVLAVGVQNLSDERRVPDSAAADRASERARRSPALKARC